MLKTSPVYGVVHLNPELQKQGLRRQKAFLFLQFNKSLFLTTEKTDPPDSRMSQKPRKSECSAGVH